MHTTDKKMTKETLKEYFLHSSNNQKKEIEDWFIEYGNTPLAEEFLSDLWLTISTQEKNSESKIAFQKFKRRINRQTKKTTNIQWWKIAQRIAAILLLPLLLSTLYFYNEKNEISETQWIEKYVAYGSKETLTLPDGSTVFMNAGSKIIYPNKFNGKNRQIFFIGEGYFNIAKNKNQPFVLQIKENLVKVLGTQFNLKSYEKEDMIELALISGKVSFCNSTIKSLAKTWNMEAGERISYNINSKQLIKRRFTTDDYSIWRNGKFYFKNVTLEHITEQLERNFNVRIIIRDDSLKQIPYHMAFVNDETLDQILNAINSQNLFKITTNKKIIEIEEATNSDKQM